MDLCFRTLHSRSGFLNLWRKKLSIQRNEKSCWIMNIKPPFKNVVEIFKNLYHEKGFSDQ